MSEPHQKPPDEGRPGLRRWLSRSVVQSVYFIVLLAVTAYALFREREALPGLFSNLDWGLASLAGLTLVVATLFYVYVQHSIYRGIGVRLTFRQVFSIVGPSQLGKYVPGKVLMASNYYLLSRGLGVDPRSIGGSFLVSTALWIVSAVLCSLPAFARLSPALRIGALVLAGLLLVSIHPRVLSLGFRALAWSVGKLRRGTADGRLGEPIYLGYPFYLRTLALYLVAWALVGLQVFLLVAALQPVQVAAFPVCTAAAAIGTVAGFVALFAPGGLGIREGVGAVILGQIIPLESALLVFALLRVMTVAADLAFGGLGLLLGRGGTTAEPI